MGGWCVTTVDPRQIIRVGKVYVMAYSHKGKVRIGICAPNDMPIDRMMREDNGTDTRG